LELPAESTLGLAVVADGLDCELAGSPALDAAVDVEPAASVVIDEEIDSPERLLSLVDALVAEPLPFAPAAEPPVTSVVVALLVFVAVAEPPVIAAADAAAVLLLLPALEPSVPGSVGFVPPPFGSFVGGLEGVDPVFRDELPPPPPPPPAPAAPLDRLGFSHGF
jgi:hypothetical protein